MYCTSLLFLLKYVLTKKTKVLMLLCSRRNSIAVVTNTVNSDLSSNPAKSLKPKPADFSL